MNHNYVFGIDTEVVLTFNNVVSNGAVGALIVILHPFLQILFGSCGF